MNGLDIAFLVVFGLGFLLGFKNGFLIEIGGVVAIIAAFFFSDRVAVWSIALFGIKGTYAYETCFIISFIAIIIAIALTSRMLTALAEAMSLGVFNRLMGAVFGTIKTALFVSMAVLLFQHINTKSDLVKQDDLQDSKVYVFVLGLGEAMYPYIENHIGKAVDYIRQQSEETPSDTVQ